ncbi:bro-4 [Sucra jujuba nucleopolyhedrovirus]|uniref:Bro-4 n=1 Tax=Sucra jujuba nucleopolyhedrovirus TaxID=1563660 RepID=A0A097P983_9ABAC|nr:bro-4 [Sucra jujuba nucleopolyhedrovirus]AIU41369.1 bro-4 [Sucra jujuba nucleopolyhedrovirus]
MEDQYTYLTLELFYNFQSVTFKYFVTPHLTTGEEQIWFRLEEIKKFVGDSYLSSYESTAPIIEASNLLATINNYSELQYIYNFLQYQMPVFMQHYRNNTIELQKSIIRLQSIIRQNNENASKTEELVKILEHTDQHINHHIDNQQKTIAEQTMTIENYQQYHELQEKINVLQNQIDELDKASRNERQVSKLSTMLCIVQYGFKFLAITGQIHYINIRTHNLKFGKIIFEQVRDDPVVAWNKLVAAAKPYVFKLSRRTVEFKTYEHVQQFMDAINTLQNN